MQYLTLPLTVAKLTAGYKNQAYYNYWKLAHYGMDLSNASADDRTLYAMGSGTVWAVGNDKIFGNVVVTVYPDCYNHRTGKMHGVTVRLYHLKSIAVKAGQAVNLGDKLGVMGNTGLYTTGTHVHLEIDTDVKYPAYAPGLKASSNIIKKGVDSTINPAGVLHVGDGQKMIFYAGVYADKADAKLPNAPADQAPTAPTPSLNW